MVAPSQFINDMYKYHCQTSDGSSSSFVPAHATASSYWNYSTTYRSQSGSNSMREPHNYQKKDQTDARSKSFAVPGGSEIIELVELTAFSGRNLLDIKRKINEAFEFQNTEMKNLSPEVYSELQPVLKKHIDILNIRQEWGKQVVILTGCALVKAIIAFAGGILGIQWLVTAAIVAAIAITSVGIFLTIWHYTDLEASMPLSMISTLDKLRNYYTPENGRFHSST